MSFSFRPAVRESTPLLLGLVGPSGSGKTLSALRLATGITKIRGGHIAAIDTEARRMLHYADHFKFLHLEFTSPFGSERYAEAITAAAEAAKGGVVIVDSMSHEHEGPGGYLDYHDQEVERLVEKGGFRNEMAAGIPAWNRPAQRRRGLINTILQINCAFIFCFRAKEKLQIKKGQDPVPLGWQAIATGDYKDLGGVSVAMIKNMWLPVKAAPGTLDLYVAVINGAGTPTYTASGLKLRIGAVLD